MNHRLQWFSSWLIRSHDREEVTGQLTHRSLTLSARKELHARLNALTVLVLAVLFHASTALLAAGSEIPRHGGILRLTTPVDPRSLDPVRIYSETEGTLACMIYRPLLDYDQNEQIVPMLAQSLPIISADGLTYSFTLRPGVRFSNGRELVADDCVYSIERHLDPKCDSNYVNYYTNIAGALDFREARKKEAANNLPARSIEPRTIAGLNAIDKYTLKIRLDHPDLVFTDVLATPISSIVPREEVERQDKPFASHPVGAGPFVLTEWKRGVRIRLDRNPNYFIAGLPYVDHVDIAIGPDLVTSTMMFERGELEYLASVSMQDFPRLKKSPTFSKCLSYFEGTDAIYISLNCEMPPFTDARVRRAINYAVDKERILKVLLNRGIIARGLLVPSVNGYSRSLAPYPHDPDKARALLTEAGYPNGFNTQLTVASNSDDGMKIAVVVQHDLAAVGVNVELRKVQGSAVFLGQKRKTVPMEIWDWIPNFDDPKDMLDLLANGEHITDDNGTNTAFYSSDAVNQLLHQGATEMNPERRLQIYQQIERQVHDDAPYLFLVQLNLYELHQPWLKGVRARGVWPRRLENAWIDR